MMRAGYLSIWKEKKQEKGLLFFRNTPAGGTGRKAGHRTGPGATRGGRAR